MKRFKLEKSKPLTNEEFQEKLTIFTMFQNPPYTNPAVMPTQAISPILTDNEEIDWMRAIKEIEPTYLRDKKEAPSREPNVDKKSVEFKLECEEVLDEDEKTELLKKPEMKK